MSTQQRLDTNGYRDPKERERERQERLRELERFPVPADFSRGGGGTSARQCGYRKQGGVYVTVPTSPYGKPLEHFLACPPLAIDAAEYGLANVGVKIVELPEACGLCAGSGRTVKPGDATFTNPDGACSNCDGLGLVPVAHVFDIVGGEYYPNVADFLEEARRLGVSRRLELEAGEYARLTPRSRLFLLHRRAVINNPADYLNELGELELARLANAECPKYHPEHRVQLVKSGCAGVGDGCGDAWLFAQKEPPGCAALYWHDIEGGERIPERSELEDTLEEMVADETAGRFVERKLASGSYRGYARPEEVKPDYSLGVFAVFPLVKIVVVDGEGAFPHKVEAAELSGIPVDVEDC
jgi:hypothetical protein